MRRMEGLFWVTTRLRTGVGSDEERGVFWDTTVSRHRRTVKQRVEAPP